MQAGIMLYQLHFLIKNCIIGLVINNIVVIEMRLDKAFVYGEQEFAKLHAFCAHVTNIARCLCFLHVYIPMYLCALIYYMPMCPHFSCAYVLTCLYIFFIPTPLCMIICQIILCPNHLVFHMLKCLQPLRTLELIYIQLMWSLMKINILMHQVL